jgi:enhancing lycopene biosynthesis protein 2
MLCLDLLCETCLTVNIIAVNNNPERKKNTVQPFRIAVQRIAQLSQTRVTMLQQLVNKGNYAAAIGLIRLMITIIKTKMNIK